MGRGRHGESTPPVMCTVKRTRGVTADGQISGGTGITPFYQLLHHTLLKPSATASATGSAEKQEEEQEQLPHRTRFRLLHGSRTPAELPPPAILGPLLAHAREHPEQLDVQLYVDTLDGSHSESVPMNSPALHAGRIDTAAVRRALHYGTSPPAWWQRLLHIGRAAEPHARETRRGTRRLVLVCGPEP